MSKGLGRKISIKFTEDLLGNLSDNQNAFTVTGKQYKYVNGPLLDVVYPVESTDRQPIPKEWESDLLSGSFNDTVNSKGAIELGVKE